MYKIINYYRDNENDMKYLCSHIDEINNLLKQCFGETINCEYFYDKQNLFIAYDGDKMIGCATIEAEAFLEYTDETLIPEYVYVPTNNYEKNRIIIFPCISGLCRDLDEKYKGVGSLLIDHIHKHFENENITQYKDWQDTPDIGEYIYLIVGSGKHHITIDSNDQEKTIYLTANQKLIDYYQNNNFERVKNCYFITYHRDPEPSFAKPDQCLHEVVMRRKLNRINAPAPVQQINNSETKKWSSNSLTRFGLGLGLGLVVMIIFINFII